MKTEEVAKIIYEATRLEAEWSKRSIVPEEWKNRDEKFKKQFVDTTDKYLSEKLPTPEEAHKDATFLAIVWAIKNLILEL